MPSRYSKETLHTLRNAIPINTLIAGILRLPSKTADGHFRFLCPQCGGFHTATNPRTNLARCFDCKRNYNTIDIAMAVNHQNFREAVQFLQGIQTLDAKKLCQDIANAMSTENHTIGEK
jgi:DNA primase